MKISLLEQIKCVQREVALRRRVYKNRVAMKQMSQAQADEEIDRMCAVLDTLNAARAKELLGRD